jgi:hypothetical protein
MSLLWTQAMPWMQHPEDPKYTPVSVKKAGFAGYVSPGGNEDVKEWTTPDSTPSEFSHLMQHDDWPSSYKKRHQRAQDDYAANMSDEDKPDHEDPRLFHFMTHHYSKQHLFHPATADTTEFPIYATQTHVAQEHLNKYHQNPRSETHMTGGGVGNDAPVLVTSEGRVHATDGHHRLSVAIARGEKNLPVWHLDLDNHYMPDNDGHDEEEHDYR